MKTIIPYLWFHQDLEKAVRLYTSLFPGSGIKNQFTIDPALDPKNQMLSVSFQLFGQDFYALNGGPMFSFTPAVSFFVSCDSAEELDRYWATLTDGGEILMELGNYPFSERYGWYNDRFGLSWQLSLQSNVQRITPFLMFIGGNFGKAAQAMEWYTHIFPNSRIIDTENKRFSLNQQEWMIFENDFPHAFAITPAISFYVNVDTQAQIDEYWEKLTNHGEEQMCGWLKDRYGISWQIIPSDFDHYLLDQNEIRRKRVMDALLTMRKIDIQTLEKAYHQD